MRHLRDPAAPWPRPQSKVRPLFRIARIFWLEELSCFGGVWWWRESRSALCRDLTVTDGGVGSRKTADRQRPLMLCVVVFNGFGRRMVV